MPLIQTFLRQTEVNLWVQDLYSKMARIQEQEKKEEEEEEERRREEEKEEGEGGGGGGGEGGRRRTGEEKKEEEEEKEEEGRRRKRRRKRRRRQGKRSFFFHELFPHPPFLNQVFCLCVLQIHQSLWHSICKQRLAVDWLILVESQAEVGQVDLKVESVIVGKHSQDLRKMQQRKMDVRWIFLAVTG